MKRLIVAALALACAACTPTALTADLERIPPSPSAAADATAIDEQAGIAVEIAYQASAQAVLLASRSGLLNGERATRAAALDRQAYAAVEAVRTAYDAGNATTYREAGRRAVALLRQLTALLRSSGG